MMKTSAEVLTDSVAEVFWKPCNVVKPRRHEAYPITITKLYDLAKLD